MDKPKVLYYGPNEISKPYQGDEEIVVTSKDDGRLTVNVNDAIKYIPKRLVWIGNGSARYEGVNIESLPRHLKDKIKAVQSGEAPNETFESLNSQLECVLLSSEEVVVK